MMYGTTNKKSKVKQFVIVVGGSFNIAFLLRTSNFFFVSHFFLSLTHFIFILFLFYFPNYPVLFLIILIADFASSVYLFCTLFLTEVPLPPISSSPSFFPSSPNSFTNLPFNIDYNDVFHFNSI